MFTILLRFTLCWLMISSSYASETITYLHHNLQGSIVDRSDANGNFSSSYDYLAYGKSVDHAVPSQSPGYTSKPHFETLGLTYYGARWYDANAGRFISIDPVSWQVDNPVHSFNRYAYANNNPYKFVDPDGRSPEFVLAIAPDVFMESVAPSLYGTDTSTKAGTYETLNAMFYEGVSEFVVGAVAGGLGRIASGLSKGVAKWEVPPSVINRFPSSWGNKPNKKGIGTRWQDPKNQGNGVRIDQGNPSHSLPSQQVDHVVVRRKGKVIGIDGKPIQGTIKNNAEQAHIPLSDYKNWKSWDSPL